MNDKMESDYNPAECLRKEVRRFQVTNTYTPMEVTGFYIQAAVVLNEHHGMAEALRYIRDHSTDSCIAHLAGASLPMSERTNKKEQMSVIFKLQFESVSPIGKGSRFYHGASPTCKPEEVPNDYWTKAERQTDDPWQQYNQLKAWAETGEQLIRNVKLFKASTPEWKPYEPDSKEK